MFANQQERYLAEEVGIDHSDGLISRREALRRLGLMGFNAVAASSILAACAQDAEEKKTPASPTAAGSVEPSAVPAGAEGAVAAEDVTFQGPTSTLIAAYAAAEDPKGAVLVIHENRGLKDHFRTVAGRLARDGYSALALDLLSEEGGTAKLGDDAAAMAALSSAAASGRFVPDMKAALGELERRNPEAKLGMVGFCFGGGEVWSMVQDGDPRLAAAAPFYGTPPEPADFSKSKAAVLAVYGALDTRVGATRPAAEAAMKAADLPHKILVYEGADHAFFNDTGQRYNADAATKVYQELINWYNQYLA